MRLLTRLRDTTLSGVLSHRASDPPWFRYGMGPTVASLGGREAGGVGGWLIWARNCPTKSNFISPEACLDNRATKWPAANLTISSTNFAGDYFTRCSLVRPRGRTQCRRRRWAVGVFLAFLTHAARHAGARMDSRNPLREKILLRARVRRLTPQCLRQWWNIYCYWKCNFFPLNILQKRYSSIRYL